MIYLLEDEQELSLGMLIRLERIYNFCLFRAYIGDIAICFATLLSGGWIKPIYPALV